MIGSARRSQRIVGRLGVVACALVGSLAPRMAAQQGAGHPGIGQEVAVPRHLPDGDEFRLSIQALVEHGRLLFAANWTDQDGGGRPFATGYGTRLADPARALDGFRSFNRVSGPDANSCAGCHNRPNGAAGGAGDFVANAFEAAPRFDFVTFDRLDARATSGSVDEAAREVSLATVGNARSTPSLFGAGYIEMLARQITADLQRIRDAIAPGQSGRLVSKGISFGTLARRADGTWITKAVEGLPPQSLRTMSAAAGPSLVIRPWHQSGSVASLREFTNTTFNQHHGIQTTDRFGRDTDPDRDGVTNELTRADVTAVAVFQATLPVPGRAIPADPDVERAVAAGERLFVDLRCAGCHVPALALDRRGWIYSEPGPYNPAGNLRRGGARTLEIDLTSAALPQPRLTPTAGEPSVIHVPVYTDFKLHDITDPTDATAREPVDMNQPVGSPAFFAGNRRFLTRRLWGIASQPAHFHHGLFTTLREAVLAHAGEALGERTAFQRLGSAEQDAVIEFLKSLQMLPPGTRDLVVDEQGRPRTWPPATAGRGLRPTR
jgi:mono/diheme cytochrome c family protein